MKHFVEEELQKKSHPQGYTVNREASLLSKDNFQSSRRATLVGEKSSSAPPETYSDIITIGETFA